MYEALHNAHRLIAHLEQVRDPDALRRALEEANLITPDFFHNLVLDHNSLRFASMSATMRKTDVCEVQVKDNDGMPYQLLMRHDSNWRGQSFKFECVGCFGDDPTCGVCGGSGWGVL